ncbi:MAG: hypothetical protein WBO09_16760 [Methylocystis silviterrae]|uniref:hypothetical protein n=1 Tax=Methylocystis silviterrae TaxID=2743612 RepID=UPI003C7524F3
MTLRLDALIAFEKSRPEAPPGSWERLIAWRFRRRVVLALYLVVRQCPQHFDAALAAALDCAGEERDAPRHPAFYRDAGLPPLARACLADALRLARLPQAPRAGRLETLEATHLFLTDAHLAFFDDDDVPDARFAAAYAGRDAIDVFTEEFLDALRADSIPPWRAPHEPLAPQDQPPQLREFVARSLSVRAGAPLGESSLEDAAVLAEIRKTHSLADLLRRFSTDGYVLHGSDAFIEDFLLPRQGSCLTGSLEGNQLGVYFTRDPQTALFAATRKSDGFNAWTGEDSPWSRKIFAGDAALLADGGHPGWVYVLEPRGETEGPFSDAFAHEKCSPLLRIPVLPQDFDARIHLIPDYEIDYLLIVGEARRNVLLRATTHRRGQERA